MKPWQPALWGVVPIPAGGDGRRKDDELSRTDSQQEPEQSGPLFIRGFPSQRMRCEDLRTRFAPASSLKPPASSPQPQASSLQPFRRQFHPGPVPWGHGAAMQAGTTLQPDME